MASIFPNSPEINDVFTSNGTTWQWNSEAWIVVASDGQTFTNVVTSPSSQTISADSPTDTLTIAAGTNISVSGNASSDTLTISSTIDTQNLINTASAAAYASASGYTNFIVDGLDTSDIEENTNLYFTNQRAIDATSSLITSASAYALSESNTYSNSASANALAQANSYTNSASASLVAYTDQEVSALQLFSNISTSPSTQLITGDSNSDTLTFISGENITISADSTTDSITINSTGNYTNVDSIAYPDYIVFDTTPESTSASVGTLAWDSGESSLSIQLDGQLNVGIGQEIIILANNGEATTLNKGEVVRLSGAQGQRPQVTRAYNLNDTGSALTIGIVAENITAGGEGFVVTQGIVKNINTNGFNEGDILYLSASAGVLTTVKPQAPNHYVFVGVVVKKNASSGRIYVKPQNGYELDELHNVRIVSEQNGDIIVWNSASTLWMNQPIQNYLNTASAAAYASASAYTDSQINALTTTDIEEGSNLYFTNERAINAGSATYILQTSQQSIINSASAAAVTAVIDGAPGALDTLNELAAALGDDENFATSVTNSLSGKLDISTASATYLTQSSASATYAPKASPTFSGTVDFTSASVIGIDLLPSQTGNNGKYLTTDGSETSWANVDALPSQTGNSGKYLTTNGASASWAELNTNSVMSRWTKAYSASTSTISGSDDNSLSLTYAPSFVSVYINGILIDPTNYTASNGTIISVVEPVQVNDIVEVISSSVATIANTYTQQQIDAKYNTFTRWTKTYSASATLVSGNDDNSNALSYVVGYENVYLNGILLTPVTDYARTSASVITLNQAVVNGDIIDVIEVEPFNIANAYTATQADNKFLTQLSASTLYSLPTQSGNSGRYLTTNGASASWASVDALPSQTGNSGRYLTTNGASASWGVLDLSTKADKLVTFDPEVASYSLVLANADQIVEMNVGSANNLTVPLNSSQPFPIGTQITILQTGTGQTTINPTGGVTVNATPGLKLRTQWSSATLIKRGTDTWVAIGDLTA